MGLGSELLSAAQTGIGAVGDNMLNHLESIDPEDPVALIEMSLLTFSFTNTVSGFSGTMSSISSATQSAAGKIGQ